MVDLKLITQAMSDLDEEALCKLLDEFVAQKPSEDDEAKVIQACQDGMGIVGDKFEKDEYFVGDLVYAEELLTKSVDTLKPVLSRTESQKTGKIILGTAQGDVHDIGKNIFQSMVEATGLEVYDLGVDQGGENFVKKIKEVQPDIIGISGLLTLSINSAIAVVDAIKAAGLRDDVKVIVDGNPMTKEACEHIGADAFTNQAEEGVIISEKWWKESLSQ